MFDLTLPSLQASQYVHRAGDSPSALKMVIDRVAEAVPDGFEPAHESSDLLDFLAANRVEVRITDAPPEPVEGPAAEEAFAWTEMATSSHVEGAVVNYHSRTLTMTRKTLGAMEREFQTLRSSPVE